MNTNSKIRIAFADDDDDDQQIFSEAIADSELPAEVMLFDNGEDLISWLENTVNPPSVVFLDLNMPLLNGIECLEKIRHTETLKGIPVVIFSTSAQQDDIRKAFTAGANLYFPKPSVYAGLSDKLRRIISTDWNMFSPKSFDSFVIS